MFENLSEIIINLISSYPYFWIFILMTLESMFIPFPSEIVMIPAGYFAAQGKLNIFIAILMGTLGSITGALINYFIAKYGGEKLSKKLIGEKNHNKGIKFFEKFGDITTLIGRLIPLIRQYISFPAGLFKMNLYKFIIFTGLGAGIWVSFLAWLGYIAGENKQLIHKYKIEFLIGIIIFAIILIIIKIYILKYKKL